MISQKKLGQKIKELRDGLIMSQSHLAKQVGLSRAAVSQIECGNRSVEALELAKIAGIFGIGIGDMLRDEQPVEEQKAAGKPVRNKFSFNAEKLKNTLLYILEKCGGKPNVGETVLYKLLYFVDFDFYPGYGCFAK